MDVSPNSELPPKKSSTQLIVFGSNERIDYFEGCKIVIDGNKKVLIVNPNNETETDKSIYANFDQDFFHLKNIFCAFPSSAGEIFHEGFILIFKNEETCKKIYENIQKRKNSNVVFCFDNEAEERFQNLFFLKIVNEIQKAEKFEAQLTQIILNFFKFLSVEERKEYLNILKRSKSKLLASETFAEFAKEFETETNQAIFPLKILPNCDFEVNMTSTSSLNNETLPPLMKSTFFSSANASKMDISSNDSTLNETQESFENDRRRSLRKRPLKKLDYSFDYDIGDSDSVTNGKVENADEDGPQIKKRNYAKCIYLPNDIVEPPNYEVKEYLEFGVQRKKLLVFAFEDKSFCRVYNYEKCKNLYLCSKCIKNKLWVRADIIMNEENNGKEYVKLGKKSHICEPIEYIPENYMDKEYIIVKQPNFKTTQKKVGNQFYRCLIIFNEENKNLCREYTWAALNQKYYCTRCHNNNKNKHGRYIFAKLIENENEEPFVQLNPYEHICEEKECTFDENGEIILASNIGFQKNGRQAKEEKAPKIIKSISNESKILTKENFKIVTHLKNGVEWKRLYVDNPNDPNNPFKYYYEKRNNLYICGSCSWKKKHTSAKLRINEENGEEYIQLFSTVHVCQNKSVVGNLSIRSASQKEQSKNKVIVKIVQSDGFKIETFMKGKNERKKLIIFDENNKNLVYIYHYCYSREDFICNGCIKFNKRVTAKLNQNNENGGNFIELNHEHVCQPREHESINKPQIIGKIIKNNGFKIETIMKGGIEKKRMIIYDSNNRDLCYAFHYSSIQNKFVCNGCAKINKHVWVKFRENSENVEESFIEFGPSDHVCEPQPEQDRLADKSINKKVVKKAVDPSKILTKENYKIDLFTEENGIERQRLIFTDPNDSNISYTYFYNEYKNLFICSGCKLQNKQVSAKLRKNEENDEDFIELLGTNNHICTSANPRTNISSTPIRNKITGKIIDADGFKIEKFIKNGVHKKRLIVYEKNDKTLGYFYHYKKPRKFFVCNGCDALGKHVTAKTHFDSQVEEYFVELGPVQHICKPRATEPISTINISSIILQATDFKVEYIATEKNIHKKRLIIWDSKENDICRIFSYDITKKFTCIECKKMNKSITAKIQQNNENGNEYLEVDDIEHVCTPVKYIPMESTCKIVKPPNYKFEYYSENGFERKMLIVFDGENNKNLCYEYYFISSRNIFTCYGCKKLGKCVTAKLHQENGEDCIKLSELEHVCQPKPEEKVFDPTDYNLEMDEKMNVSKITIFYPQNKSLGYEFKFYKENRYRCNNCFKNGKICCEVKFFEDAIGNFYVKNGNFEHSCQPLNIEKTSFD